MITDLAPIVEARRGDPDVVFLMHLENSNFSPLAADLEAYKYDVASQEMVRVKRPRDSQGTLVLFDDNPSVGIDVCISIYNFHFDRNLTNLKFTGTVTVETINF